MALQEDIKALFPRAKDRGKYIMIPCPYHKGGDERHPSMSILLEPKDGLPEGFAKCFTCEWTGTFAGIAEDFGLRYVPDTYTLAAPQSPVQLNLQKPIYKSEVPYSYSQYLASRGIPAEIQEKFRTSENAQEGKVYMPVFSKAGEFLYANARSTKSKMYFVQAGATKTLAYLEEVDFGKPIAICESQINALTLYSAQFSRAVATLGVANISALSALKKAVGPFLLMFDGDDAGEKATEQAVKLFGKHRCIVFKFMPGEDVNSLWQNCNFNSDLFADELEKRRQDG